MHAFLSQVQRSITTAGGTPHKPEAHAKRSNRVMNTSAVDSVHS